jgi:hypothetical protein
MWTITNLRYTTEDGIVFKVEAKYEIVTGDIITSNTIWVRVAPPTENIIPFADLTEQEVLNWVFANYETDIVEEKVLEEHNAKVNEGLGESLPWN